LPQAAASRFASKLESFSAYFSLALWSAAVLRRFPLLQKKLRTLCGLDPRPQKSCFAIWIGCQAHSQSGAAAPHSKTWQ